MPRAHDGRDLETSPPSEPSQYTIEQELILQILVIVFSSFSMVSGILSLYWFLIMRRVFRHDLIMFLIQSDMFKAFWMMVYGIASLMPGSVNSSSALCQIIGFFTSLSFEASDFAVLAISLHSALYIFNPSATAGEGGLYPYRYWAFGIWLAFPVLMASLAFANPHGAYHAESTGCTLPIRPFWYRLALSWLPRYVVFITILGLDVAIYAYIRYVFRGVWECPSTTRQLARSKRSGKYTGGPNSQMLRKNSVPTTPRLAYNGLLPDSRQASVASRVRRWKLELEKEPQLGRSQSESASSAIKWVKLNMRRHTVEMAAMKSTLPPPKRQNMTADATSITDRAPSPKAILAPESNIPPLASPAWAINIPQFNSQPENRISILSFLRNAQSSPSENASIALQMEVTEVSRQEIRDRLRQQLRFLFFYPLAYMGMWIIPFTAHILQYKYSYAAMPPFVITVFSSIFLASQCAVDCWIFSIREKPWRLAGGKRMSLKKPLEFLKDWNMGSQMSSRMTGGAGKSRGQRAADARLAYMRREEERAARESEVSAKGRSVRGERSWWDESESEAERMGMLLERNTSFLDEAVIRRSDQ